MPNPGAAPHTHFPAAAQDSSNYEVQHKPTLNDSQQCSKLFLLPTVSYHLLCYQNSAFPGCILHCSFTLQRSWPFAAVMKMGKIANFTVYSANRLQSSHARLGSGHFTWMRWAPARVALIDLAPIGRRSFFSHIADCPSWKGSESSSRKPESVTKLFSVCQLRSKEDFKNAVWGHSVFIYYTSHSAWRELRKPLSLATSHVVHAAYSAANTAFIPEVKDLKKAIRKH